MFLLGVTAVRTCGRVWVVFLSSGFCSWFHISMFPLTRGRAALQPPPCFTTAAQSDRIQLLNCSPARGWQLLGAPHTPGATDVVIVSVFTAKLPEFCRSSNFNSCEQLDLKLLSRGRWLVQSSVRWHSSDGEKLCRNTLTVKKRGWEDSQRTDPPQTDTNTVDVTQSTGGL